MKALEEMKPFSDRSNNPSGAARRLQIGTAARKYGGNSNNPRAALGLTIPSREVVEGMVERGRVIPEEQMRGCA